MTRDEWVRAEQVLTSALPLSAEEQKRVVQTAFLKDAIQRELLEILRRASVVQPLAAVGGAQAPGGLEDPATVSSGPLLVANDSVADGRFRIIRQLGRGGMGEVYLASDTKLETLVALKVLLHESSREAQHARRCSGHPNIVTLHDVIETTVGDRAVTVLVMEHVAGRPASDVIEDGPVPIMDAVRWARETASALAHAHDCGVLHCDLKPANILVTPDGAKVVDFGIGRFTFEAPGSATQFRGTLPYMAPEQLADRQFSRAGDVYSLGVTLFELITGRLPFAGDGVELVLRIIGGPPPRLRDFRNGVPADLEQIVAGALAKDPAERHRSARAFEQSLRRFEELHGEEKEQPPQSVWLTRAVYGIAGLAGALLVVTFAGFVTSTFFNSPLQRRDGFDTESLRDWIGWGTKALIAAALITALAAAAVAGMKGVWKLVASLPGMQSVLTPAGLKLRTLCARIAPTAIARAKLLLLAQVAFLLGFGWYFQDIIKGLDSFVSRGSPADLWALGPHNRGRQTWFDFLLCLQVWIFGLAWVRLWRRHLMSDKGSARVAAGGLAIAAATVLVGQVVPFRIIYHNWNPRVAYGSQLCYMVGQRGSEALLFCPLQSPPWSRIVPVDDPALQRDDRPLENIFSEVPAARSQGGFR